ncbi:sensor domain-containing diguanylate cyclase [Salinicoccus kekensis]|uniref:PAS domain S-box-containing protein/diguanylate cyclase (GGDEF)-like protein n=1 Tax=Salinicoccus kekensis TaxID=714307 RepID=A0A285UBC5_9STAP|nr:sensor domain-containing diguanylate cyclase [Salinicoccus kekensis]SOC39109.1 PAS domain S-box-containing protein/diguanylate cyclase (GGDEF)-like protein [Salinicoccus kekensis]
MQSDVEYSKEELIKEIDSLKRLNKQLLETFHETEKLEFGWTGNLGQWFWDFTINEVTYNPMKATALGYTEEELPEKVPYEFFTEKLHPDDYEHVMQMMRDHLEGKIPVWEVKYRIQAKDGSWKVYQDRGKVTERTEDGAPLFLKGIVFDVTDEEEEKEQLKVKNNKLRSQMRIDALTSLYARQGVLLELSYLKEREDPQSIIVLRVDDYAKYEEELGIFMSENILKTAGKIIKDAAGEDHFAGRYRETVFMILLDDAREEEAYAVAEKVRKTVMSTVFEVPRDITISGGVAEYMPGETVSELIHTVTEKLVAAQRQGGNRIIG